MMNNFHNLPQDWQVKTLGEIAEISSGGTPSRSNKDYWENGTIAWVKIADMKDKYLTNTAEKITELGLKNSSAKIFSKGTLLYSVFATLGRTCILDIEATTNQAIAGINPKDSNINTLYLMYFLQSIEKLVCNMGRGATQNNINLSILKQIKIPLPPLATQKAIVEKLENAFAHIDEAVRHLRVVQTNIPRLKSSLLHCAFSGKLTESPICHSEGEARRISKDSTLRDISLVSQAQYDTIALTQNQIAFSKYPAFIYIVSNKNNTTLYIGVTSNLQKRIYEHKNHLHKGFSDKYNCEKLVYFESFDNINQAIEREKYLKGKKRAFKENLINAINPKWLDLYGYLFGDISHFSNAQYDKATCHSEALAEESQEIFRYAQNDKEDNLPQGWEVKTLGEVCEFVYGKALNQTKRKTNGKYPVYAANGIKDYSDEFMISENSIIVGRKGSVGSIVLTSSPCWVLDVAYYVNFDKEKYNLVFLYHLLKYLNLKQFARGVKPGISRSQIYELQVVMPPLATQNQIVQILESKFAHLEKLAQFVNTSLENLQRLKSSLLNQAFKGELIC